MCTPSHNNPPPTPTPFFALELLQRTSTEKQNHCRAVKTMPCSEDNNPLPPPPHSLVFRVGAASTPFYGQKTMVFLLFPVCRPVIHPKQTVALVGKSMFWVASTTNGDFRVLPVDILDAPKQDSRTVRVRWQPSDGKRRAMSVDLLRVRQTEEGAGSLMRAMKHEEGESGETDTSSAASLGIGT